MTIKQKLWLSDPSQLQGFIEAPSEEEKWCCISAIHENVDMTTCGWLLVGTAEVEVTFSSDSLKEKAVTATDIAIAELTKTFQSKLEVLESFKQTLLCLEAPKTQPAD